MRIIWAVAALAFLCSLSFAGQPVLFVSPNAGTVADGGTVDLGSMGPGQTITVSVESNVKTGGSNGIGGRYDILAISGLPEGWSAKDSKLFGNQLQAEITAARDAQDGEYQVTAVAVDAYDEGLGNSTFTLNVHIKREVMGMTVEPASQEVGAGQPARYTITISNTGSANDVYVVGSTGVRGWTFTKSVYVPAGSSKQITYEVVGDEEESYNVQIEAKSSSSDLISQSQNVELKVYASALSDFKAVPRGLLIFPIIEGPVYYVFGLLSNLF